LHVSRSSARSRAIVVLDDDGVCEGFQSAMFRRSGNSKRKPALANDQRRLDPVNLELSVEL